MIDTSMLTIREKQVLAYILQGKTAAETAVRLGVSSKTVEVYVANILRAFNVRSKGELMARVIAALALKAGIDLPSTRVEKKPFVRQAVMPRRYAKPS